MPWAAHGVTDEQAVAERSAVVRARCADGEDLRALPRQQYGFAVGVPGEHVPISERGERHTASEIRAGQFSCLIAHVGMLEKW